MPCWRNRQIIYVRVKIRISTSCIYVIVIEYVSIRALWYIKKTRFYVGRYTKINFPNLDSSRGLLCSRAIQSLTVPIYDFNLNRKLPREFPIKHEITTFLR
jgi:hypothetical protein